MFLDRLNEVLASEKSFISDRLNAAPLGSALLINIIHWTILLIKIKLTSGNIVLHYNVIYGADFVDRGTMIYVIPALALVLFLLNLFLSVFYYKREKLAAYFLNFATIIIQLIFIIASINLIRINE